MRNRLAAAFPCGPLKGAARSLDGACTRGGRFALFQPLLVRLLFIAGAAAGLGVNGRGAVF